MNRSTPAYLLFFLFSFFAGKKLFCQENIEKKEIREKKLDAVGEKDIVDVIASGFHLKKIKRDDTAEKVIGKVYISILPNVAYAIQTRFSAGVINTYSYYSSKTSNISNIYASIDFTQNKQIIGHIQSVQFTKDNKWNFLGDWRFLKYPVPTYGLGAYTTEKDQTDLDFNYVRIYEQALKKITKNIYAGVGYCLDYHWGIEIKNPPTSSSSISNYELKEQTIASGIALNIQYDSRKNSICPDKGTYFNAMYRYNDKFMGSNSNWHSLTIDARYFVKFPKNSNNVLAFWNFDWLILDGKPPYLDLPTNGWDTYSNTGRGYIQGRFRGPLMFDFESEYRIRLTRNGLFGMVVFGSVQTYSGWPDKTSLTKLIPGGGAGIRIKLNKFSQTNISIDYGIGIDYGKNKNYGGIFLNLGEVF